MRCAVCCGVNLGSLKEYGVNICKPEYVSDIADENAAH